MPIILLSGEYYTLSASRVAEGAHCYIYLQKDQDVATGSN